MTQTRTYRAHNLKNASHLLADLNLLLSAWDESKSVDENLDDVIRRNLFGKASRHRVVELVSIFRQRYVPDDGSARAFRLFASSSLPAEVTDRVIYYYTAIAEPALYDFVTDYLYECFLSGETQVSLRNTYEFFDQAYAEGKVNGRWKSESTREQAGQGLLATLREMGMLSGGIKARIKTLAPAHLHILAFAYIAFHIHCSEPSGEKLVHHPHWRLFFLNLPQVEMYFAEADAHKLLTYQAAGSIIRIEFPTNDFEEYVHALIEKPY